MKKDKHQITKT